MNEKQDFKCAICDSVNPGFSWTDTHGVAQCFTCGTPYRIFHYEGEGEERRRIDRPPSLYVLESWVSGLREYWNSNHRRIPSGCSFPGGYELATREDQESFNQWAKAFGKTLREAS